MKSHYYCTVHNRSSNRRHCVGPGIMLSCRVIGSGIATSLNLPLPGRGISRKRRRHWRRQILKLNPRLNPAWLDARYDVHFVFNENAFSHSRYEPVTDTPRFEKAEGELLFTPVYHQLKI